MATHLSNEPDKPVSQPLTNLRVKSVSAAGLVKMGSAVGVTLAGSPLR